MVFRRIADLYKVKWQEILLDHEMSCLVTYTLNIYLDTETLCDAIEIDRKTFYYYMASAEGFRINDKRFNAIYLQIREELKPDSKLKYIVNAA